MRSSPYSTVEITVSFRMHESGGPCAFVTCIVEHARGQRELRSSNHFTGTPERLLDLAIDHARVSALEEWLPLTSPF